MNIRSTDNRATYARAALQSPLGSWRAVCTMLAIWLSLAMGTSLWASPRDALAPPSRLSTEIDEYHDYLGDEAQETPQGRFDRVLSEFARLLLDFHTERTGVHNEWALRSLRMSISLHTKAEGNFEEEPEDVLGDIDRESLIILAPHAYMRIRHAGQWEYKKFTLLAPAEPVPESASIVAEDQRAQEEVARLRVVVRDVEPQEYMTAGRDYVVALANRVGALATSRDEAREGAKQEERSGALRFEKRIPTAQREESDRFEEATNGLSELRQP